jgi:hypothetical protein
MPPLLFEVLSVLVGLSIGMVAKGWGQVLVSCIAWGFICWLLVWSFAGNAEYKPGTPLFYGSPALTHFIVWWPAAFLVSLASATVVQFMRS